MYLHVLPKCSGDLKSLVNKKASCKDKLSTNRIYWAAFSIQKWPWIALNNLFPFTAASKSQYFRFLLPSQTSPLHGLKVPITKLFLFSHPNLHIKQWRSLKKFFDSNGTWFFNDFLKSSKSNFFAVVPLKECRRAHNKPTSFVCDVEFWMHLTESQHLGKNFEPSRLQSNREETNANGGTKWRQILKNLNLKKIVCVRVKKFIRETSLLDVYIRMRE